MASPTTNKPKITKDDITVGYVKRYFVRHVSRRQVTEVDPTQYRQFSNNPYYQTLTLNWVIGGNDVDLTGSNGLPIRGAAYQNTKIAEHYNGQMQGIATLLRNPLEFFSGTRLKDQPTTVIPPSYSRPQTMTVTTTAIVPEASLTRTESGRLFATAASPIVVTGVETAFLQSDWTSMGDAAIIGLNTPELGGTLTPIAVGASPGTRTYYINVVDDRTDGMMFHRITNWSRTQILSLPMARVDTPAAQFPTQAIYALARNSTSNSFELYERSSSATVQSSVGALATPAPTTVGLRTKGSTANAWTTTSNTTRTLTGVTMQTAGKFALGVQNFSPNTTSIFYNVNRVAIHADDFIRVESPIGIRASILDADSNVLASVDDAGGTADINLWDIRQTYCPEGLPLATKLQVYDLDTLTLQLEVEPEERLWGGDVWEFTPAP